MTTPIDQHEGKKYLRTIHSAFPGNTRPPISVDVYSVLKAFKVKDQPAGIEVGHAIKKLLCPGERGKGDYRADLVGAIAALNRAIDNLDEDANQAKDGDTHEPVVTVKKLPPKKALALTFEEYEAITEETAIYPPEYAIAYCLLGLIGEIPEIIEAVSSFPGNTCVEEFRTFRNSLRLVHDQASVLQAFSKKIRDNKEKLTEELKKALGNAQFTTTAAIYDELGDALYYLCRLARAAGSSLEAIAARNNRKLLDRKARGVLGGSGDNR